MYFCCWLSEEEVLFIALRLEVVVDGRGMSFLMNLAFCVADAMRSYLSFAEGKLRNK